MKLFVVFCLALLFVANALKEVPQWARGGEYYKNWLKENNVPLKAQAALTWAAPLDHFNATNKATFNQRYLFTIDLWL
jgi:hypothetical protein